MTAPQTQDDRRPPSRTDVQREAASLPDDIEQRVGVAADDLASLLVLDGIRGFGPQKFKELHQAGVTPTDVLREPQRLPLRGRTGDTVRRALSALTEEDRWLAHARAVRQLTRAHEHHARIVTYGDPSYPPNVYASNNPIPVLYVRGNPELLSHERAVAGVGSRETGPPYSDRHREFSAHAAGRGFSIASGFALGADTIGHRAAHEAGGRTTLVMPCGLDRPFPPENRQLWRDLLDYGGAVIVSEFPFGTAASALTLRKRNKLIVAFAGGVMLSQTSATGGAMNAYRFAIEQRKAVATFADDGTDRTSGNRVIAGDEGRQPPLDDSLRHAAVAVFPADRPAPDLWDAWLQRLSFST